MPSTETITLDRGRAPRPPGTTRTTASARSTDTIVVGAGQAGLALSHFLTAEGHGHVVLDRGRIGERWRSERWDSLSLLTPNWLNTLPGMDPHADPDGFLHVAELVTAFERYAASFDAPILEGTTVLEVAADPRGFRVATDRSTWTARNVVLASGDSDVGLLPAAASAVPAGVSSFHATRYRSPDALAPGGVLVVGAGPTGQQLALELARAGREVTIAVGRHARMPRRYRGRDIWRWLEALGDLEVSTDDVHSLEAAKATPSTVLSGARGGEQLDLDVLTRSGVTVTGRLLGFSGRHALLGDGLAADVEDAERRMQRVLRRIDAHIERAGEAAEPPTPLPRVDASGAPGSLDLAAGGIGTVLWATGYRRAYPWLRLPVLRHDGEIVQRHGRTTVPGLHTLGLKFQRRRSSHFIGGVGADAELLAQQLLAGDRRLARAA